MTGGTIVNKNELVSALASKTDMSKNAATNAVDTMIDVVTRALRKGDDVRLVGFGTFYVTRRAASKGRNPRTGEPIMIKASKQPKFKAGKGLKDAVNNAANNN